MQKTPEIEDLEWIDRYKQSGDMAILGELYRKYMHLVYGVCLKYLKDRDQAQDEVMAVFEVLVEKLVDHKVENFKSWLYVLTKNHCLMLLRKEKSHKTKEEQFFVEQSMESESFLHPIDEEDVIESHHDRLHDCIERLKEEQKQCVLLFYLESKSYQEIVDITQFELKKVKSYIQNGKRNLKMCLENRG